MTRSSLNGDNYMHLADLGLTLKRTGLLLELLPRIR
jgi:hypothetical protein